MRNKKKAKHALDTGGAVLNVKGMEEAVKQVERNANVGTEELYCPECGGSCFLGRCEAD